MSKWVKCSERLPEFNQHVICFGLLGGEKTPRVEFGYYSYTTAEPAWSSLTYDGVAGNIWFSEVTQWMPKPSPPEEENNE